MNIDRTISPEINKIDNINLIKEQEFTLDNGVKVIVVNGGSHNVSKIDIVFNAGTKYEDFQHNARTCNSLLFSGTKEKTASEISEFFDFHGAHIIKSTSLDYSLVSLVSINKHLSKIFPIFIDNLFNSIYPEKEFNLYKQNTYQDLQTNEKTCNYLAQTRFNSLVYNKNNPYSKYTVSKDIQNLNLENVKSFFEDHYHTNNCFIMCSGNIDYDVLNLLNSSIGQIKSDKKTISDNFNIDKKDSIKTHIKLADSIQTSIKIGKRILIDRNSDDYYKLLIANTILGGYFGSRLMTTIREEKGYTYGIYSRILCLHNDILFTISTETNRDVTDDAIESIFNEIKILQNELLEQEELDLVKNYLLGHQLRNMDGSLNQAEAFTYIKTSNLAHNYISKYFEAINNISTEDIKNIFKKYFQLDTFSVLTVGDHQ